MFTVAEANELIPQLKKMLLQANQELLEKDDILADAFDRHQLCEQEMAVPIEVAVTNSVTGEQNNSSKKLLECRQNFQNSIQSLSQAKQNYIETLDFWLEEISHTGVILRDIKSGLLDFPAQAGDFEYHLCWQANEDEIRFWHMTNEGYSGRRPLAVLKEYS